MHADKKGMRASDEPNVDVLRQKARILESENERLSEKVSELLRENLALKGMAPTARSEKNRSNKPSHRIATRPGATSNCGKRASAGCASSPRFTARANRARSRGSTRATTSW